MPLSVLSATVPPAVTAAVPPPRVAAAPSGRLTAVARGSTLNLAGAAFSGAATVALTVLVTRSFSKAAAGAFFTATSVFLIAETAASLGGYVGLVNVIARLRSLGRETSVPAVLRTALVPVIVVSVAVAAALAAGASPLARLVVSSHLAHTRANPVAVTAMLRWLAVALPFAAVLDTLLGASRGYRAMQPTVVVDRLGRSGLQLAAALVAGVAGGLGLLAPLWALPYLPAAVAAWLWLRSIRRRQRQHLGGGAGGRHRRAPGEGRCQPRLPRAERPSARARWRLAQADARAFWRFTAPRGLASLAQITIQRLDIVLVAALRGPAAAAIYTAATRFLVAGQFANSAISMAAQPRFAELFAVGDRRETNAIYQATTAWLILLTWPMYLLVMIFGPPVLAVFGHSYRAGGTVMLILAGAMLLATACGQVDMVLIASGRSSWSLLNGLLAVVVNVGLDLLLIPRYGIAGAAVGWAAAIALSNLVPLAQLAALARVHPFGRMTFAAVALPAICFAAVPLAMRAAAGTGAVATAAGLVLGTAVLAASGWRLRRTLQLSALAGVRARWRGPSQPPQSVGGAE